MSYCFQLYSKKGRWSLWKPQPAKSETSKRYSTRSTSRTLPVWTLTGFSMLKYIYNISPPFTNIDTPPTGVLPWRTNIYSAPRREPELQLLMVDEDQLASALYALRLVAVSVLPELPVSQRVELAFTTQTFSSQFRCWKNFTFSDFRRSRSFYPVYLGLHHNLRNGGRSRLEIKVGFREGAVSGSTLLALFRYRVAYFQ